MTADEHGPDAPTERQGTFLSMRAEPAGNNPDYEPMLQFFEFDHLPPKLAQVSAAFAHLAFDVARTIPRNPERTVALRKLLEAKDCAVRAVLFK